MVGEVNRIITGELFPTINCAIISIIKIAIYRLKVKLCRSCLSRLKCSLEHFVTINDCIEDDRLILEECQRNLLTLSHFHPGLQGQHLEMIPSDPESSSVSLCAQDDNSGSLPEVLSPQKASNSTREVFPLPSSLPNILVDTSDSEPEEDAGGKSCEGSGSESENEEERSEREDGRRLDSVGDEDNDEDQDYDEVVVQPRPLNEVTSLTDKTSPWTSVLSDLDMGSLESVEETNEANLSPAEAEKLHFLNQLTSDCSEQSGCDRRDANRSAGDASDADCGDERSRQPEEERREKESESPTDLSRETRLSPRKQEATANHYTSSSQDQQPQTYPYGVSAAVVCPVFFLQIYL